MLASASPSLRETVEQIRPDLIIPTGKRKGQNPSSASIYRALATHEKTSAYPDAVAQASAEFAERHADEATVGIVRPRPGPGRRPPPAAQGQPSSWANLL